MCLRMNTFRYFNLLLYSALMEFNNSIIPLFFQNIYFYLAYLKIIYPALIAKVDQFEVNEHQSCKPILTDKDISR